MHYVINFSELVGNVNYLASNQFLKGFIPMPQLVGGLRPTEVFLPSNYDPSVPAPVLLSLPGYSCNNYFNEYLFNFADEASSRGYIYIKPNGIRNSIGDRFWKATDACCDFIDMG